MREYELSILNNYIKAFEIALEYYNETSHYKAKIITKKTEKDFTVFVIHLRNGYTNKNFLFEIGRLYEKFIRSLNL